MAFSQSHANCHITTGSFLNGDSFKQNVKTILFFVSIVKRAKTSISNLFKKSETVLFQLPFTHTHTHTHIHTRTHTLIHTNIHTRAHTYTQTYTFTVIKQPLSTTVGLANCSAGSHPPETDETV